MKRASNFKYAYYSLIKVGADEKYYEALLQLVLLVIKKKNYTVIKIQDLCKDFKKTIGFEIPYFPMQKILETAHKKGYLTYNNYEKKYNPDYNIINKNPFMKNYQKSNNKFCELIKSYKDYVLTVLKEEFTTKDCEETINKFIEENGMLLFREKENYFNNSHEDYVFSKYLEHILNTDKAQFDYVIELIIGRIFSEFIMFSPDSTPKYLNRLTIYLDTGFVFRLLGIDSLERKEAYQKLLNQMHEAGIKTKLFYHTFNEISTIISNSLQWIGNTEYDPYISNETTYYFIKSGKSKEDVQEILDNLRSKISELNIEILDMDYPQNPPSNVIREADYHEAIVNYYLEHNTNFNEEDKEYTVSMDARSFYYTDVLSNGIVPNSITEATHLFVTTNISLSTVSRRILNQKKRLSEHSIPFCITDRFIGVVLWKNSPDQLKEETYNRLLIGMKEAFSPNDSMLEQLSNSLKENLENKTITDEECYLLKTSHDAHRYLMELTKGNPELFTEKTPLQILNELRKEAKVEGAKEERNKANNEIQKVESELETERSKNAILNNKLLDKNIEHLEMLKKQAIKDKDSLKNKKSETLNIIASAEEKASGRKRKLSIIYSIIVVIYVILGVLVWLSSMKTDWFSLYTFLAPALLALFSYIYFAVTSNSFNVFRWTENITKKVKEKQLSDKGITPKTLDIFDYQIKKLDEDINKYKEEIDKLMLQKKA